MITMQREDTARYGLQIDELRLPAGLRQRTAVEERGEAMLALDPMVQRLLPRLGLTSVMNRPALTVYDAVYAATPEIGGHWTVAARWLGFFTHTVSSFSITLAFDAENLPSYFVVAGARTIITDDVSERALAGALEAARKIGPMSTTAPHIFANVGL